MSQKRGAKSEPEAAREHALPHNLDAERSVLGAILLNNAAHVEAARVVSEEDFFRDAHRRIYKAMTALVDRPGGAVDFLLLREELAQRGELEEVGGVSYLAGLTDGVPRATNVRYYASIVHDKAQSRRLIYSLNKAIASAYEQDQPIAEVIEDADRSIIALRHGSHQGAVKSLASRNAGLMADLEFRVANRGLLTGIDTGFKSINDITNGWQAGDLIIVAARPSMGKTAFVLKSIMAAAEFPLPAGETGERVALAFSMEMKARQLEYRWLSALSEIPATRLTGGFLGPDSSSDWGRLTNALDRMHRAAIYIDDSPAVSVGDVRAECRRLQAEHRLDLVVIDYVQLMRGTLDRRNATRTEELTDISRKLKRLAGELSVPIILVSQLKRTGGGRPKLEDLRESGSLEQDADIVAFLHRRNHREGGTTEFIVEKNRNGPTGPTLITFHKDTVRFEDGGVEPTPEEQAEEQAEERKASKGRAIARRRKVTI